MDCAGKKGDFAAKEVRPAKTFQRISRGRGWRLVMEDLAQHVGLNFVELLDGGFQSRSSIERGPDEQFVQTKCCMTDEDLGLLEFVRVVQLGRDRAREAPGDSGDQHFHR